VGGRARYFATPERAEFLRLVAMHLTKLGMTWVLAQVQDPIATADYRTERLAYGNDGAPKAADYDVLKVTPKWPTPRTRKLLVTESTITERDAATYGVVSARPLASVFALVRHWNDPQKLTIEYRDGTRRSYLTSLRDACLGSALDACRNAGNIHVAVTSELSRPGDRVLPLTTDEHPETAMHYLKNMERAASAGSAALAAGSGAPYSAALVRAALEFNANVSPVGLPYGTKKGAVSGVLPHLTAQATALLALEAAPSAILVTLLSAVARVIGSGAAYKLFLSLPDSMALLTNSLSHEDEGVVYWGIEILRRLMHNPRRPVAAPAKDAANANVAAALGIGDIDDTLPSQQQFAELEAQAKKVILTQDLRVAIIHALDVFSGFVSGGRAAHKQTAAAAKADALSSGDGLGTSNNTIISSAVIAAGSSGGGVTGNEGTLIMMSLTLLLDSILVSHVDTTPQDAGDHLMQLVASRYAALLSLFRCQCSGVVESAAILMRAIVEQADEGTCRAMQTAAISSGVWLRHFYNAAFASSMDQRFVSRYLVELWSTGNVTAREVLRHMLPVGIILYLDMPKMSQQEMQHLEGIEASTITSGLTGATKTGKGLASRLRLRIESAERASSARVRRRLAALDENAAGARRGFRKNKKDKLAQANVARAAAAAVAAQREMTKTKIEGEGGKEANFPIFFFQMSQDHVLPDLIWNQQTRAELRSALEAELREIEREIELGGQSAPTVQNAVANTTAATRSGAGTDASQVPGVNTTVGTGGPVVNPTAAIGATVGAVVPTQPSITGGVEVSLRVAWNFAEFEVDYPSLLQELKVGDYYLRLFLESGEAAVASLRDPPRFFDALYRRVLRETAPNLKCVCLRGMSRVYEKHHRVIGPFEDTDYMVFLLSQSNHADVRDRLLGLLHSLSLNVINCEKMLNPDCLELLVDLLTTAHTAEIEQRSVPVLKGGESLLLLQNDTSGAYKSSASDSTFTESEQNNNPKESMKVWHYRAAKADLAPGEKPEKGPYSLQDMCRLGEMKKVGPSTLVWAQGMREWVRLDSLRALQWYCLSEGTPGLTPIARGEVCVELLKRLVILRPSVDAEGAPVRPVPRAKRILCGPRTLPHIAQALLAGSPKLVELVAELLVELVRYNPKAMVKLYMSGLFFFVLGYNGSNWSYLAQLLASTHLQQSFHSDAASLASETSLGKRSILGSLLPESMVCVLENRGAAAFADVFLSNVDTPEVIWKYSMRGHLLDMVVQHLGDLPGRLAANPCTLYDYCPIPPVKYEELENELWCHNFYLANLCDEQRFPNWTVEDPVGLLRATLEAWRMEITKKDEPGAVTSTEEAYTLLGIPSGSDEKEIRKAYRKLAIKYHPDKNPAGRDVFEKINKAYELLTSGGKGAASAAAAANVGGANQNAILLMIRTQCILFARHAKLLKTYKYAGYPLVIEAIANSLKGEGAEANSSSGSGRMGKERVEFLEACTRLVYLTCLATPRNAEELIAEHATEMLITILARFTPYICTHVSPALTPDDMHVRVTDNALHTLSGLATMKDARDRIEKSETLAGHMSALLSMIHCAKLLHHALECVARLAVSPALQEALVSAGVIYRLLPLLFRYDVTLEAAQDSAVGGNPNAGASAGASAQAAAMASAAAAAMAGTTSTAIMVMAPGQAANGALRAPAPTPDNLAAGGMNDQKNANIAAKLALRAIARLGGYLEADLATPSNARVRRTMAALLSPPIAQRLARPQTEPLLRVLNSHEESGHVVWNAVMRKELLSFVGAQIEHIVHNGFADVPAAFGFLFSSTREELRMSGVFVRYYINDPSITLEDPYAFVLGLLEHVALSRVGGAFPLGADGFSPATKDDNGENGPPYNFLQTPPELARRHLRLALRALHLALVNCPGTESIVAKEGYMYTPALFQLLDKQDAASDADAGSELVHAAGQQTNKAAAGSGASAGAGGARSTPASPNASLRELVLTAIAAFVPFDVCGTAVAKMHLIPALLRQLPRDSGSVGPILRTLFSHTSVIQEMGRVAGIIDLVALFAGGNIVGNPASAATPHLTVPKPARAVAATLLSLICSDATQGPPLLIQLQQLIPDTLAIAVKESVSSGASVGTGSSSLMNTGVGIGAAGAGGGSGAHGDVVMLFDSDHDTPELIWNSKCRSELRSALAELVNGLSNLRKRAADSGAPGGYDGVGWTMPPTFRVRYSAHEGELRIGGIFIRLFLKEPTYPLRDPRGFMEALLRRFHSEAETLCAITSEDGEKARKAAQAASEAAKAEEAAGGVAAKTRAEATGEEALVVRGEDLVTQVTHALICLLRVRTVLGDHVAALGYIPKLVSFLSAASGKPSRYSLGIQCVRVLHALASSKNAVVAAARANAMTVLIRSMQPLHRDAGFTLEAIKLLLEADSRDSHMLVEQAIRADIIGFVMKVLEKENLEHLVDPSAAKVHAVAIMKVLEQDAVHGPSAAGVLQQLHGQSWERYRHQKHDLFLSRTDQKDYFLTDIQTKGPAFMLKNTAEWSPAQQGHYSHGGAPPSAGVPPPSSGGFPPATPQSMLTDLSVPPPAPDYIAPAQHRFGNFQAPAPAPVERPTNAPAVMITGPAAAAPVDPFAAFAAVPATKAPSNDPFADLLS
jgi:DnaJ family protein C protein 13